MADVPTKVPDTLSRRDQFAIAFGAASLTRRSGATPSSLANEIIPFVDAFLTRLDAPPVKAAK